MTKDEIREKVKKYLLGAYDAKALELEARAANIAKQHNELQAEIRHLERLREEVDHNLNRANERDLGSYHFLFFGTEKP